MANKFESMSLAPNINMPMTSVKLNGKNYMLWSRSVEMFLKGKGLRRTHLIDPIPASTSPTFAQWEQEDAQILSLMLTSIEPSICSSLIHFDTAQEVWGHLKQMYSGAGNITRIYELCKQFFVLEQNALGLEEYYSQVMGICEELKVYQPVTSDVPSMLKQREDFNIVRFLVGLKPEYESVRSQILASPQLPSFPDVFSRLQRATLSSDQSNERSALTASYVAPAGRGGQSGRGARGGARGGRDNRTRGREFRKCTHCGRTNHSVDYCWDLHGRPSGSANRNLHGRPSGSANQATVQDDSQPTSSNRSSDMISISKEEYERFLGHTGASSSTATLTHSGIASACLVSPTQGPWIIDSGANEHLTGLSSVLSKLNTVPSVKSVTLANGSLAKVTGIGSTKLTDSISLSSVLHAPSFPFSLLSISRITQSLQCSVTFYPSSCVFQDLKTGNKIGTGHEAGGLYYLDVQQSPTRALTTPSSSAFEWHCRLGHPSLSLLKCQIKNLGSVSPFSCEACQLSKHHRVSFVPRIDKRASSPFELVHSDIWGPINIESNKFQYFVTFVDDYSRVTWLFLIKARSELLSIFQMFWKQIKTQFNKKVQILRSDNGREYLSGAFATYLSDKGIVHQTSCSYTPQQNGVAERKNRHLLDVTRALLLHMHVPKRFWSDGVLTACHLINRMPSSILNGSSPFSVLFPSSSPFSLPPKIFGCVCFVHNLGPGFDKLDPRSTKCLFVGYSRTQKGYRCYSPTLRRYFTSADVTFFESIPFFSNTSSSVECDPLPLPTLTLSPSQSPSQPQVYSRRSRPPAPMPQPVVPPSSDLELSQPIVPPSSDLELPQPVVPPSSDLELPSTSDSLPIALRKGSRSCVTQHPISQFVSYHALSPSFSCFTSQVSKLSIPKTLQDALSDPGWRTAMESEMDALHHNRTWDLVPLPPSKQPVGCKWVYTIKFHPNGSVERLKARLVAKGYTQTYGIDYEETFSPVAKISSVRVLISLAANLDWPLFQLDVKNAFLHGDLHEEVYMEQPPGFVAQGEYRGTVCRLKKALYGLKQSPRAWFGRFSDAVLNFGLHRCQTDHSVFHLHSDAGHILLVVYVDDIVITGSDSAGIIRLKQFLHDQFQTKDLGKLRYFLGIEVSRSKEGINLSQRKYVLDLLEETGMLGARPIDTPMDPNRKFLKEEGELFRDPGSHIGMLWFIFFVISSEHLVLEYYIDQMDILELKHFQMLIGQDLLQIEDLLLDIVPL
ncbi:uncharacterized protein LOC122279793 isoform X1 [Carya illinoinensis]|uniref:uncharacterized protein LOC122279793 isoform X1 n=1 Tax=Carya illinoinensis TaxID=32201 RepID=UPI001C71F824|nr:uncharacterized protein LOC122279793 isoform X1 [Carya illinoinensis]